MASDTITVKFKVLEDGSLAQVGIDADKAADGLKNTGKGARTADRNLKGAANMTSNTSKQFSKMAQGITGGLVPAYATLAANVFAISAAFNFFKRAADIKILEEGQKSFGASTGMALQTVTAGLREASGGMLGFREAAEAAAIGVAKGFSPQQLNDLADGARKASAALGRNFEDSFDRLLRGASKAEPELLDELGITLRLATATENYGRAIGKNAKDLTAFERSQAVLIETQRQLNDMYGDVDAVSNPFVKLQKTFDDIVKAATQFLLPIFEGLAAIINRSAMAAIAVFGMLGVSIFKSMIPLDTMKEGLQEFTDKSKSSFTSAIDDLRNHRNELQKTNAALKKPAQNLKSSAIALGPSKSALIRKAQTGQLTDPKQIGQLKAHLKKAIAQHKRYGSVQRGIFKGVDMERMLSFQTALNQMQVKELGFFRRQKMRLKTASLSFKLFFTGIKTGAKFAFIGAGKAAMGFGRLLNSVMAKAGFIGIFIMLFEMMKQLKSNMFDILMSVAKGTEFVVNKVLSMIGFILVPVGKLIDNVRNAFNTLRNGITKGLKFLAGTKIGKALGLDEATKDMKLLPTELTTFEDKMKDLTTNGVKFADSFANLDFMKKAKEIQTSSRAAMQTKEAFKNLQQSIKTTGEEFVGIKEGIDETTEAFKKQQMTATALSSMGLSRLVGKIAAIEDETKRTAEKNKLVEFLSGMDDLVPGVLQKVKDLNVEGLVKTETTAQAATGGLAALKDGIRDVNSAIEGNDLLKAELGLKALMGTAESTSDAFKQMFGEDAEAAKKAMQDFRDSFSGADMTADQFLATLTALRKATDSYNVAVQIANFLGGERKKIAEAQNEITKITLDLEKNRLLLAKATTEQEKIQLRQAILMLGIQEKLANVKLIGQTQGSGMAAAERISGMLTSDQGAILGGAAGAAQNKAAADELTSNRNTMEKKLSLADPESEQAAELRKQIEAADAKIKELNRLAKLGEEATLSTRIGAVADTISPMAEELAKLGPEGEYMSTALMGAMTLGETFADVFANIGDSATPMKDGLAAAASAITAISSIMAASSKAQIAEIDKQIEAEKKRDGKSAQSQEKLKALEKKKEQMKRKAFEQDKKMKMAQTVISTATAIMSVMDEKPPLNFILAGLIGAMGAAQLSVISSQSFQGGASGGASVPSKINIGNRSNSVDLARGRSPSGELAYARGARGSGSGMTNFTPAFSGYKMSRANGGYVVGEQGPELFMPETPGEIVPSGQGMGGSTNVNFSINAVDAAGVEELLMSQRGNIISMIRESANANGEFFLENVNTGAIPNQGELR